MNNNDAAQIAYQLGKARGHVEQAYDRLTERTKKGWTFTKDEVEAIQKDLIAAMNELELTRWRLK